MTATTFRSTELFGGAILVDLPSGFVDVSDLRQVPDHQEVYLDKQGFTSITFDILERVDSVANDDEALKYHLEDITDSEGQCQVLSSGSVKLPHLPDVTTAYTLLARQHPTPAEQAQQQMTGVTTIVLTLVRLQAQNTDLAITVNVPDAAGQGASEEIYPQEGTLGKQADAALVYRDHILETFQIRDWGLFM